MSHNRLGQWTLPGAVVAWNIGAEVGGPPAAENQTLSIAIWADSKELTIQHICKRVSGQLEQVIARGAPGGRGRPIGGDPEQVEDVGRLLRRGGGPAREGVGGRGYGPELLHGGRLLVHQLLGRLVIDIAPVSCSTPKSTNKIR